MAGAAVLHFVYTRSHREDAGQAVIYGLIGVGQLGLAGALLSKWRPAAGTAVGVNLALIAAFVGMQTLGRALGAPAETITTLTVARKSLELLAVALLTPGLRAGSS